MLEIVLRRDGRRVGMRMVKPDNLKIVLSRAYRSPRINSTGSIKNRFRFALSSRAFEIG